MGEPEEETEYLLLKSSGDIFYIIFDFDFMYIHISLTCMNVHHLFAVLIEAVRGH